MIRVIHTAHVQNALGIFAPGDVQEYGEEDARPLLDTGAAQVAPEEAPSGEQAPPSDPPAPPADEEEG